VWSPFEDFRYVANARLQGLLCHNNAFFSLVSAPLVRNGADEKIPGRQVHVRGFVYSEMMLQVARDYPGVPDVRTLKHHQILFFYDALRAELKKPTGGPNG
jgi:hypothetical protein